MTDESLIIKQCTNETQGEINELRQNSLLNEAELITFAKDKGIQIFGVVKGDVGKFNSRGWLPSDGSQTSSTPLFHPFRVYALHKIIRSCRLPVAPSAWLEPEAVVKGLTKDLARYTPSPDAIAAQADNANEIVDLAILLEPVYWPSVIGMTSYRTDEIQTHGKLLETYKEKILRLLRKLNLDRWQKLHEQMRFDASWIDDNTELYVLLRLSKWMQRQNLKGHIAAALWLRHIAEVVRKGFEGAHTSNWPEEDIAFGTWMTGARAMVFGAERPLDDVVNARPYIGWNFGIFTGSTVRWYLEGDTEYFAVKEVISEPARIGIELVNLRGSLQSGRDNAAFKLQDALLEDRKLRRFSFLSFDIDVPENVKAIRRQMAQDNVVGFIGAHIPDFELSNFSILELVAVVLQLHDSEDLKKAMHQVDWTGVSNAREFEEKCKSISPILSRGIKGEAWGRALAQYAWRNPSRPDTKQERPFIRAIRAAVNARLAHYDVQMEQYKFDVNTFEIVKREDH